ncbi:unnamed protein product [Lymnaea stagnalis]|uniref:Uncharacterized protein n=1 Tax=Lymnaea stagnalis TaxID=6523 RepID=A0AAV2IFH8_LYMST
MLDKRQDEQLPITNKALPDENTTQPKEEARDLTGNNFSSNGERPLEEKLGDLHLNKPIQFPVPVPHLKSGTKQRSRPHSPEPNKSSNAYARSLSAVYTNQQPDRGVHLVEDHLPGPSKRGSGGSPELPGPLLPYAKKGQVVYHSAMIQLSLTPEVDTFINSIDEENKLAIENRLSSIGQEILVLRRQRKKTQRFYSRLNKGTKVSKGDQHVSEQTMKELNEVTKKLAFLQLCRTHLEVDYDLFRHIR